ncbi:MAG TPA: hypothetical protein VF808_10965 [Ktedonobacterales bacterium]
MRRLFTRRRALILIAALALLVAAFEAGIRLVPPDAVAYDIQTIEPAGPPGPRLRGVVTDPATIAHWRAAMTAHPGGTLPGAYVRRWQGVSCSFGTQVLAAYTFTWHGLPVEVVRGGVGCDPGYQISSGGLPDWNTYLIDPLPQP